MDACHRSSGKQTIRRHLAVARKGTVAAITFIRQNPRAYAQIAVVIVVGPILLALFAHYIAPPLYRAAAGYYASTDTTKTSALLVALAALVIAWNNYRRGNTAIVKLVRIRECGNAVRGVNNDQMFHTFEVSVKNLGIPLKHPAVLLQGYTQLGSLSIPLNPLRGDTPVQPGGALEKGMLAMFAIRSFELSQGQRQMIAALADPEAERVAIAVYSHGYLIKRFPLRSLEAARMLKRGWNRIAFPINSKLFWRTRRKWGRPILHSREILPTLRDHLSTLQRFASQMRAETQDQVPTLFRPE